MKYSVVRYYGDDGGLLVTKENERKGTYMTGQGWGDLSTENVLREVTSNRGPKEEQDSEWWLTGVKISWAVGIKCAKALRKGRMGVWGQPQRVLTGEAGG